MGQVKRRDPVATRKAILEAALALFLEKGFSATATSEIAETAGVNKSLIHHYFGSKKDLWRRCFDEANERFRQEQAHILEMNEAPSVALMERAFASYFRFLGEHPEVLRLMAWMALEPEHTPLEEAGDVAVRALHQVSEFQRLGVLRADVEPGALLAAFCSLAEHYHLFRIAFRVHLPRQEASDDEMNEANLVDLFKILIDGARARPSR